MHPQATVDRARRLSRQGLIDREVAGIVGVSLGAVQKWRTGIRRAPGQKN
jgi:transposase